MKIPHKLNILKKPLCCLVAYVAVCSLVMASNDQSLDTEELQAKVVAYNDAFNRVFMQDSTVEDVEELFAFYSDDFIYEHDGYGGTYSRTQLHANTVERVQERRYNRTKDRYRIISMISGHNAIALERELLDSGKKHLCVIEFKADKITRIVEYWK